MDLSATVWDYLGKADVVFSLLATIFAGFAALKLWQQNHRIKELAKAVPPIKNFKEQVEYYSGIQTSKPVAFAISLIPRNESIRGSVQTFLKTQGWKMEIEELNMNGINNQEELEKFINDLRKKRRLFDAQQVTELHLFIAGPVVAGAIVGALFDNWIPVKLYHKSTPPKPTIYEYWMPLIK